MHLAKACTKHLFKLDNATGHPDSRIANGNPEKISVGN